MVFKSSPSYHNLRDDQIKSHQNRRATYQIRSQLQTPAGMVMILFMRSDRHIKHIRNLSSTLRNRKSRKVIPFPLYRALSREREWLLPGDSSQIQAPYGTQTKPDPPPASRMLTPSELKSLKKKSAAVSKKMRERYGIEPI